MQRRAVVGLVLGLIAGCATKASPDEGAPPEPFERRLAAQLAWQPGDAPPVAVETMPRLDPAPSTDAAVVPMQFSTQIRNRCSRPATLAVGSAQAEPHDGAAGFVLAAGAAIWFGQSADDLLFVRVEASGWHSVRGAGGDLVLSGARCDTITELRTGVRETLVIHDGPGA
jgi:hypothetical protein